MQFVNLPKMVEHEKIQFEKHIKEWALAVIVVVALLGGTLITTLLVTAWLVSDSPEAATRWGWMHRWVDPTYRATTNPLVCEGSQAAELTQHYTSLVEVIPFTFQSIEILKINDHRVRGKARVICPLNESETTEVLWEAEFVTEFDLPLGTCIREIKVRTPENNPCPLDQGS